MDQPLPFSAFELLCEVAAAVSEGDGDDACVGVKEVEAFSSVRDMIHAAIELYGGAATLQQIYVACQVRGRVRYSRTRVSRLITQKENWKSQIRHALYKSKRRFKKYTKGGVRWTVLEPFSELGYSTNRVIVSTSEAESGVRMAGKNRTQQGKQDRTLKLCLKLSHEKARPHIRQAGRVLSKSSGLRNSAGMDGQVCAYGRKTNEPLCPVLGFHVPRKQRTLQRIYIVQSHEESACSEAKLKPSLTRVFGNKGYLDLNGGVSATHLKLERARPPKENCRALNT